VAVYDRWHRDPQDGDQPCRCGRGRNRLYPSGAHLKGDRWQVRWRTPEGTPGPRQPRRNFALRDPGPGEPGDPEVHASAFDKVISASIVTRTYVDPKSAEVPLREFAEQWRRSQKMDVNAAADVERRFRLHVYEGEPGSGRTPRGGVSIGQHPLGLLAARPSLTSAWITAMPLAPSSALHVVCDVSAMFAAAMDDGIIGRDPTKSPSVDRPRPGKSRAVPWTIGQVDAQAAQLPPRWAIVPELGAATGMRKGEMLGLDVNGIRFLGRNPRVDVTQSLKIIGGELRFGPVKNRKPHTVPLAESLSAPLARHLELFPAREVTLPWHDPGDAERHGLPVTVRLVISAETGPAAVDPLTFNYHWMEAVRRAGITLPGRRRREDGCHVLRHTFASMHLRAGVDIVRVAAWMGDTVAMVSSTYAHLMPGDDDADGRAAVDLFFAGRRTSAPDVPSEAAE
jgi:integrase